MHRRAFAREQLSALPTGAVAPPSVRYSNHQWFDGGGKCINLSQTVLKAYARSTAPVSPSARRFIYLQMAFAACAELQCQLSEPSVSNAQYCRR